MREAAAFTSVDSGFWYCKEERKKAERGEKRNQSERACAIDGRRRNGRRHERDPADDPDIIPCNVRSALNRLAGVVRPADMKVVKTQHL